MKNRDLIMTSILRKTKIILLCGLLWLVLIACGYNVDERTTKIAWRYYSFNSDTIIDEINQGNTDVFNIVGESTEVFDRDLRDQLKSEATANSSGITEYWRYEDYLLVAQTISQNLWNESPSFEKIYMMHLVTDCDVAEKGKFYSAGFFTSRDIQSAFVQQGRLERSIHIDLRNKRIIISEHEYFPNVYKKQSLEISAFQITAGQALQIADQSGGGEIRSAYGNLCSISVTEWGEPENEQWNVVYSDINENLRYLFDIEIDARTGEVVRIVPLLEPLP